MRNIRSCGGITMGRAESPHERGLPGPQPARQQPGRRLRPDRYRRGRRILVKTRDPAALPGPDIVAERPASVRTRRTWEEVAAGQAGPERE